MLLKMDPFARPLDVAAPVLAAGARMPLRPLLCACCPPGSHGPSAVVLRRAVCLVAYLRG